MKNIKVQLDDFNKIHQRILNKDVGEGQTLLLIKSLPSEFDNFGDTLIYCKDSQSLDVLVFFRN